MVPYILLFAYFAVLVPSLWKLFAKAGQPSWAAIVPVYNVLVWLRISGKPWWWIVLFLVPGINLLMLIIMNVNVSIVLDERRFKDHVLMVFLPWVMLPKTTFDASRTYVGPIPPEKRQRGTLGQWGDAILFAVIVATAFRTFTFEAFTIPTPSMEKSLLVGDYLFVSKLSYGPRMPITPITFPFTHHTMPFTTSTPSFTRWFTQPYRRLPGFGNPQRGDAVVFNFPEGDTVVANHQNQSYYQLVRDHGRAKIHNPDYRLPARVNGQVRGVPTGGILVRPLDKRENYIKRCVAIAGDTLEVRQGEVHINGQKQELPEQGQFAYDFRLADGFNPRTLKEQFDVNFSDMPENTGSGMVNLPLVPEVAERVGRLGNVRSMERQNTPAGTPHPYHVLPYFPNHEGFDWSEDNYGPIWIPKAGATVQLTLDNLPLFRRTIALYEGNDLRVEGGTIFINGEPSTSYTFKQDYYWLMGDNRHRSQDSRFWGYVPHDHVVGKAVLIWLTVDPEQGGFPTGIRWKRLFSRVR